MKTTGKIHVKVVPPNRAPAFTQSPGDVSFTRGTAATKDSAFRVTDPDANPVTVVRKGSLPAGVTATLLPAQGNTPLQGVLRIAYDGRQLPVSSSPQTLEADDGKP